MPESKTHLLLKEQAKHILKKQEGFKAKEIMLEYKIQLQDNKFYIIDAVGINNKKKVFIECGYLTAENRLKIMKGFCDKVIHLPYIKNSKKVLLSRRKSNITQLLKELTRQLESEDKWDKIKNKPLPT